MSKKNKTLPVHVGIIMDGNRRWASSRGLSKFEGHKAGYENFIKIAKAGIKKGIKILTFYAFSRENWKRSKSEVAYLMRLLKKAVRQGGKELHKEQIKLLVSGRLEDLSLSFQKKISRVIDLTKNNKKGIVNIALSYSGRAEIVDAFKKILKKYPKISPRDISEDLINQNLYNPHLPDPDLIIRTSGEYRLSGFLTWEGVYSELYFVKKYWPDFTVKDLDKAIKEYQRRQRRYGGD